MFSELVESVLQFVENDRGNRLPGSDESIFYQPLIGVVDATDPTFETFRKSQVIGKHHYMPKDWLASAETVISYFLPITEKISDSNRDGTMPSERWMYARFYGELFNERLRRFMVSRLRDAGFEAVAPLLDERFVSANLSSNWPERHVAYAAELGSFGLHYGLITPRGVSGRFGSVITSHRIKTDSNHLVKKENSMVDNNCLWFSDGSCKVCIDRCLVNAITTSGKDKVRCSQHLNKQGIKTKMAYGFPYSPCGKCYVGVPCERTAPGN